MLEQQIEGFRLSPQQKFVWLLQQRDKLCDRSSSSPYIVRVAISSNGKVDVGALKAAFQKVVDRHEILRTSFKCLPGMTVPLQVISETYKVSFTERHFEGDEEQLEEFIDRVCDPGLTIINDVPLSVELVSLASKKYLLIISLSALIADRVSTNLLLSEIASCYCEREVTEAGMQYADIAEWQNEILENSDDKFHTDERSLLNLWFENSSAESSTFQPQVTSFNLENAANIVLAAQEIGVNIADILLAAWQVLLWKLTRVDSVAVSTAIDNRRYAELERSLGLLTKYIPLRSELAKEQSFAELARQISRFKAEIEDLPEYFVNPETSLSAVDYPIGFEYGKITPQIETDGVYFSIYHQYACLDRLKLKLTCLQKDENLDCELHYDPHVFGSEDIETLKERLQLLLKEAIANPETAIGKLEITSEAEREKLLFEFNRTETNHPQDKCIVDLFAAAVKRSPDAVAVVCDSEKLTYNQLNEKSDRLASHLQEWGIAPETPIALCTERSVNAIAAMLGILKAGAVYVPIDPSYPTERLAFILSDSQASVIVTQDRLISSLPAHNARIVCLDTLESAIAEDNAINPTLHVPASPCLRVSPPLSPKNLAYIIYTSGSTGTPKGIAVERRQLLNYIYGILERLDLPTGASFATVSTLAADLGNTAIFSALATGGCLHVISQDKVMDAEALAAYFEAHPVDCLKIVPSHLEALLNSPRAKSILPKQRLVLGGEALSWDLVDRLRQLGAECQIINHYGPTETTVGVLTHSVGERDARSATVPIGKPITNTQIYILNEYLQPVPIGVAGEIYIGGASVARGYWQKPELTAEKFIQNPFFSDAVGLQRLAPKIYQTGDLARYLPDGSIEFLGRIDNQVKIRGFRVELGEIETALEQHPDVERAVVRAREDAGLVAYLVASQDRDWRGFLSPKLPDYAIPSAFIKLAVLPLTPNGKVDWQRLPAPERNKSSFIAPRNEIEQNIAAIWSQVLGIDRIGIEDNFFDLGGHSLSATQVISRLRQFFEIDLPLRYLFDFPTIARFGEAIAQKIARQADSEVLAQMLAELEELSPAEVEDVLTQSGGKGRERS